MAIGGFSREAAPGPMSEINTTPLVDVMLVLLVIMIITAPMLVQAVKVDLPRAAAAPVDVKPEIVRLAIDAGGRLFVDGRPLEAGGLAARLSALAARTPQPEVHVSADRTTPYEHVARAIAAARQAGLNRLRFVTLPGDDHAPTR